MTQLTANSTINANDWGYTYDAYSRLTCARLGTTTCGSTAAANRVAYTLDAFGRTYQRTLNTTATSYVWRGIGEDPASSTTSGTTTTYAYTAGGSPLAQKVGTGAASYYLRDPHGDTVGVVSATAAEQGTTAFDAYGKPLATSGTQALFGYQSDMTDTLTKQVDMGTRWYAPGQGRFTTRDVLFGDPLHPISLNQWVYGASNPVTMWDPTGMAYDTTGGGCSGSTASCMQNFRDIRSQHIANDVDDPHDWSEDYKTATTPRPPPPEPRSHNLIPDRSERFLGYGGSTLLLGAAAVDTYQHEEGVPWWEVEVTVVGRLLHNSSAESLSDGVSVHVIDRAGNEVRLSQAADECFHAPVCEHELRLASRGSAYWFYEGHPIFSEPAAIRITFVSLSCQAEGCLYLPDFYDNEVVLPLQ